MLQINFFFQWRAYKSIHIKTFIRSTKKIGAPFKFFVYSFFPFRKVLPSICQYSSAALFAVAVFEYSVFQYRRFGSPLKSRFAIIAQTCRHIYKNITKQRTAILQLANPSRKCICICCWSDFSEIAYIHGLVIFWLLYWNNKKNSFNFVLTVCGKSYSENHCNYSAGLRAYVVGDYSCAITLNIVRQLYNIDHPHRFWNHGKVCVCVAAKFFLKSYI